MKIPKVFIYTAVLAFVVLLFLIMQQLSFYLIPALFGALLAMLMLPLNRRMEKWRIPRILAITISLFIILIIVSVVVYVFATQVIGFVKDFPTIQDQLASKFTRLQSFITEKTGYGSEKQTDLLKEELTGVLHSADKLASSILAFTGGTVAAIGLMIVHFFLFLLYRGRIREFFLMLVPQKSQETAETVIEQIARVTRQYLTGVVTVMAILSVLNSTGFLILGIKNAIFFGILAAVLNIIPYVGVWIGTFLPLLLALITKDSLLYPIGVIIVVVVTQFIDNHFLTPRITGSQVKINALSAIAVIIIGNLVWGVAGMILFIPLLGMLKIIFDNVEDLKPLGYLIGDDESPEDPRISRVVKRFSRSKAKK